LPKSSSKNNRGDFRNAASHRCFALQTGFPAGSFLPSQFRSLERKMKPPMNADLPLAIILISWM